MKYVGERIYQAIPNRYPFMILDTLEVNEKEAIGEIILKEDLWIFQCHYPNKPMLPMSLLIESMTQVFISTILEGPKDDLEIPLISSIGGSNKISMREGVIPGDRLKLVAELQSFRRGVAKGICKAYKNDTPTPIMEFDIVEVLPSQMIKLG